MKKILTMYLLACSSIAIAATPTVSAADYFFWNAHEVVSGTVINFDSEFKLKNNVAVLSIANSDIKLPSQYSKDTSNCKAYLLNPGDNTWTLMRITCDYQSNKQVRIYALADINVPPLNIGDKIDITTLQPVPIGGYFKMMMIDNQWSDTNHIQHYLNGNL